MHASGGNYGRWTIYNASVLVSCSGRQELGAPVSCLVIECRTYMYTGLNDACVRVSCVKLYEHVHNTDDNVTDSWVVTQENHGPFKYPSKHITRGF